jgi:hypothetical protein
MACRGAVRPARSSASNHMHRTVGLSFSTGSGIRINVTSSASSLNSLIAAAAAHASLESAFESDLDVCFRRSPMMRPIENTSLRTNHSPHHTIVILSESANLKYNGCITYSLRAEQFRLADSDCTTVCQMCLRNRHSGWTRMRSRHRLPPHHLSTSRCSGKWRCFIALKAAHHVPPSHTSSKNSSTTRFTFSEDARHVWASECVATSSSAAGAIDIHCTSKSKQ